MVDVQGAVDVQGGALLEGRLRRYQADRYPVQHATAQFHLGSILIEAGRPADAEPVLRSSAELLAGMSSEAARATNLLGVALRLTGRVEEAAAAFEDARSAFEDAGEPLEQGAALHNLGLAQAQAGRPELARPAFEQARSLFRRHGAGGRAVAAARELGAVLLSCGEVVEAGEVLEEATSMAERAGDEAGRGAAANALGLARLAAGATGEAVAAFLAALGAHPRSVRPEAYAMVKANLALAHERAGDRPRARLAARQALGTPAAPGPVRSQAAAVLERLGTDPSDMLAVLDDEPGDRWTTVVREELLRWVDSPPDQRAADVAAWVDGQLAREDRATDLAQAWLGVVVELPPTAMEELVRSLLLALPDREERARRRFRSQVSAAMGAFNVPQWMRLKDTFERVGGEVGAGGSWN
ncbi:MAG: tetratricopeptide repeat protein [Acidimicrobiales bacterium]